MQKYVTTGLAAVIALLAVAFVGCSRQPALGKLQIMYSGNIRGNVVPCG
jgi:hypothetical protein